MAGYDQWNKKEERLRRLAEHNFDTIVTRGAISREQGVGALVALLVCAERDTPEHHGNAAEQERLIIRDQYQHPFCEPERAIDHVQPNDLQGAACLGGTAVGPAYASDPVWMAFLNAVHLAAQRLREPPEAVFTRLFALVERRHKAA
jgi:hypothetical protein